MRWCNQYRMAIVKSAAILIKIFTFQAYKNRLRAVDSAGAALHYLLDICCLLPSRERMVSGPA